MHLKVGNKNKIFHNSEEVDIRDSLSPKK